MKQTCVDLIKKALYFQGGYSTDIFLRIKEQGGQVGIHSVTNRLSEGDGIHWIGKDVEGHKEKYWELIKKDKEGNRMLL